MIYVNLYEEYYKNKPLIAYHGTSDVFYDDIIKNGLQNPYLAANYELAEYYAEESVYENGGNMIIFKITIFDKSNLRIDYNALDEPVNVNGYGGNINDVEEMYNKISLEHPEWINDNLIMIPNDKWEYSWNAVKSIRYDGIIPPKNITIVN